jgi:2-hydroxycyclohexanecarboxyl-CoA dehydrogenase
VRPTRTALVTGAASGIGAAIATRLTELGWSVAGFDLQPSATALSRIVDISDPRAVREAIETVETELGPVEALAAAAGHYESVPIADVTTRQWDRMLRVHLGGLINTARVVLPGMIERGSGSIVSITSELALGGGDADSHYAAAKGALIGLVRSLAAEAAPHGVRVNAVAPGPTDTPLLAQDSSWRAPAYLDALPARRLAHPYEAAAVACFLIEEGMFCVGEVISPNSGEVT